MNLPGFTAESSLYEVTGLYKLIARVHHASAAIQPQFEVCDTDCLYYCQSDCGNEVGRMKGVCVRACHQQCCHTTRFPPRL